MSYIALTTSLTADVSAPAFNNNSTAEQCNQKAARCSDVFPSCTRSTVKTFTHGRTLCTYFVNILDACSLFDKNRHRVCLSLRAGVMEWCVPNLRYAYG